MRCVRVTTRAVLQHKMTLAMAAMPATELLLRRRLAQALVSALIRRTHPVQPQVLPTRPNGQRLQMQAPAQTIAMVAMMRESRKAVKIKEQQQA